MSKPAGHTPLDDLISGRPASTRQRRIIWIVVFVALIALAVLTLRFLTGHDTSYISQPAVRGDLEPRLSIGGVLYPTRETDVGMPFAGTVAEVYVREGTKVAAGQQLARIDPADARLAMAETQAGVQSARAAIESASAVRDQAVARLARIEDVYRRSGGRVPSRRELEEARATARAGNAELDSAKAHLQEAEARLAEAQRHIVRSVIRAPISGYVLVNNARPGALETDTQAALFTLSPDIDRMRIDVLVPQAMIGDIKRGARARVTVSSLPDERFEAWVTDIATTATGAPPAFRVTLIVVNREGLLRRGVRASVDIRLRPRRNVLLIPNAAFHFEPATKRAPSERNDGRETIYVLNGEGGIVPVAVSAGSTDGTLTEVHSDGLKVGDPVVVGWRGSSAGDRDPAK